MGTVSLRECEFVKHRPVKVLAGQGSVWYGQIVGGYDSSTRISFVVESSVLRHGHTGIHPGDIVEVATLKCPRGVMWIGHFDVVIDCVRYKHGDVFMRRLLNYADEVKV